MRLLSATLLLLSLAAAPLHAQEAAPPATHQEAALQLTELLERTEACLAGCTDAASVQAALPELKELAHRVQLFKEAQDRLPEPTTQDYMAAQELLKRFNTAWQAIRAHIERLQTDHLISQELSDILILAPAEK